MDAPGQIGGEGLPAAQLALSGPAAGGGLPGGAALAPLGAGEWRGTMAEASDTEGVVATLVGAGVGVRAVIPEAVSLEETYLKRVGGRCACVAGPP